MHCSRCQIRDWVALPRRVDMHHAQRVHSLFPDPFGCWLGVKREGKQDQRKIVRARPMILCSQYEDTQRLLYVDNTISPF